MANYVSTHTLQEFDMAISYYLSLQNTKTSKQVLSIGITDREWQTIEPNSGERSNGKYKCELTVSGLSNVGAYPIVYMMTSNSNEYERWELDYNVVFSTTKTTITCYSNKKIAGNIIITSTDRITGVTQLPL